MALKTKLSIDSVDSTGRIFNIHDSTGIYDLSTNDTGYGFPNPEVSDIDSIVFTISRYKEDKLHSVKYVRSLDPLNPEFLTIPSIEDIANGTEVNINSITLGITTPEEGLKTFADGVYDITMYTILGPGYSITVSGDKGNKEIIGNGLDIIFNNYFYINFNNIIYTIDKSRGTNAGENLYLIEDLKDDIVNEQINPVLFSNKKALNDAGSNCCISNGSGKLVLDSCCSPCESKFEKAFFKLILYKMVAKINFNLCNYDKANDLLDGASKGCKSLKCNCK